MLYEIYLYGFSKPIGTTTRPWVAQWFKKHPTKNKYIVKIK